MNQRITLHTLALCTTSALAQKIPAATPPPPPLLTGQAAYTDWAQQRPGVRHKITLADLPAPDPAEAVDNGPNVGPPAPSTPGPSRPPASASPSTPAVTPNPSSAKTPPST